MSYFEGQELKKPAKSQEKNHKKRRHHYKKKTQQVNVQEDKKILEQKIMMPPLMIKSYSNLLSKEEFEQPLEQYVDSMYEQFQEEVKHKHNKIIQSFQKEDDQGNIEYKLKLVSPTEDRLEHLATQMKYRVKQGTGQAYYRIGVQDNGKPLGLSRSDMFQSLKTICHLARKIQTDVLVLRVSEGIKGLIIELMIRKFHRQGIKLQIRLLLFGQSDSGKSTLLAVLKSGEMDDGKGHARVKVFSHKHEFMTGTTTTKSHHVIGFNSEGKLHNQNNMISQEKWFDNVNKLLTFIDVGGHKKAEKQFVSSLCSFFPQYALWIISGKNQLKLASNNDNLELAKIFNLPLIVVITHLDTMNEDEQIQAIYRTKIILKKLYVDKTPCVVKQMEHAVLFSRITSTEDVIPIFIISNVTGQNLDLLTNFLNLLPSVSEIKNNEEMNTEFLIADKYGVANNIILLGTVIKGTIKKGQILHLGPDLKGTFRAIEVISIECLRIPVKLAKCGQVCTIAIHLNNYAKQWLDKQPNGIRRGMVLVESKSNPRAAYEYLAQFTSYGNRDEIKIRQKYQPVINTLTTRQICTIINLNNNSNDNQAVEEIPMKILKKKSKSIDNFQQNRQNQMKKKKNSIYIAHKQIPYKTSYDLNEQSLLKKYCSKLLPIHEQMKVKKKKQFQQIRFKHEDIIKLRLRFKYYPQYIAVGQKLIINELKLVGKIKEIYY